ncbi:uncharacterized protein BYT42DRAFT_561656 [Radiomyces spectabilis]|uniref:uncharacterized protein n=1 Tax=Radiomyces spectabilis TaxID=64574 RepID=UPI00221E96DC|nr:uncharacterized protein BYT42DRAFT_561656 [Radiomyces spectabilis]KAI8388904.1 hypothetical protein BYT42DRAFT_561656 [Radiomyces spectabilis]
MVEKIFEIDETPLTREIVTYHLEPSQRLDSIRNIIARQYKRKHSESLLQLKKQQCSLDRCHGGLPSPPVESPPPDHFESLTNDKTSVKYEPSLPSSLPMEQVQEAKPSAAATIAPPTTPPLTEADILEKLEKLREEKHRLFQLIKRMVQEDSAKAEEERRRMLQEEEERKARLEAEAAVKAEAEAKAAAAEAEAKAKAELLAAAKAEAAAKIKAFTAAEAENQQNKSHSFQQANKRNTSRWSSDNSAAGFYYNRSPSFSRPSAASSSYVATSRPSTIHRFHRTPTQPYSRPMHRSSTSANPAVGTGFPHYNPHFHHQQRSPLYRPSPPHY